MVYKYYLLYQGKKNDTWETIQYLHGYAGPNQIEQKYFYAERYKPDVHLLTSPEERPTCDKLGTDCFRFNFTKIKKDYENYQKIMENKDQKDFLKEVSDRINLVQKNELDYQRFDDLVYYLCFQLTSYKEKFVKNKNPIYYENLCEIYKICSDLILENNYKEMRIFFGIDP